MRELAQIGVRNPSERTRWKRLLRFGAPLLGSARRAAAMSPAAVLRVIPCLACVCRLSYSLQQPPGTTWHQELLPLGSLAVRQWQWQWQ